MAKVVKIYREGTAYTLWWNEPNVIAVTQAEYNALTEAEKTDGKLRIISDAPAADLGSLISCVDASPVEVTYIWAWTQDEYDALSSYDSNTIYFTTDS